MVLERVKCDDWKNIWLWFDGKISLSFSNTQAQEFSMKTTHFFLKHPISRIFCETTINNLFFTQHPNWRIFRENNQFSFFSCKRCKPNFSNFQWKQCTYIQMVPMDKIKAWSVITQLVHVNHSCVSFLCVKCGILTNFPSLFSWIFFCTSQNW